MAYDDFKEGCSVIKGYVDDQNKETVGKIPTKVSELTNDSKYATESYVNTAIGNIAQPTSLPQTYKKKAVTLATSGWMASPWTDIAKNTVAFSGTGYFLIGNTEYNITNTTSLAVSDTVSGYAKEPLIYWGTTPIDGIDTYMFRTADKHLYICVGYQAQNKGKIMARVTTISGVDTVTVYAQIDGVTTAYNYAYTDADVKVNSEVRFTLDEASGKIAGQFGLKKTIDKEAGKLTFTADTLPTSAITGTLEIGETSTEGAAFVEGIIEPSSVPEEPLFYGSNASLWGGRHSNTISYDTRVEYIHIPSLSLTGNATSQSIIAYQEEWPYKLIENKLYSGINVEGLKNENYVRIPVSPTSGVRFMYDIVQTGDKHGVRINAYMAGETAESTNTYNISFDIEVEREATT